MELKVVKQEDKTLVLEVPGETVTVTNALRSELWEDKNVKDIAKIMRTKQNTIKTYLFRARKRLQELLADALGDDVYVSE